MFLKKYKNNSRPLSLTSMSPSATWKAIANRTVPFLLDKGDVHARMITKNYKKMLIVRHPMERLVSFYKMAFINKFHEDKHIGNMFYGLYFKRIKQLKNRNLTTNINRKVSFSEFVDFVIAHHENVENGRWNNSYGWDCHIIPITRMCFPCLAKYNIIAKVETLDEDLALIFKQFGLRINATYPHKYKRTSASLNKPLLNTLSQRQLQSLKHIYRSDMELFGYN